MFKLDCSVSVDCIVPLGLRDGKYHYKMDPDFKRKLDEIRQADIKKVELDLTGLSYAWVFEEFLLKASEAIKEAGLTLNSLHLPFGMDWVDLVSPWENDRKEIVRWMIKIFGWVDKYNPAAYVLHPGGYKVKEENRPGAMDRLCLSASELAKGTKTPVCIENMVGGVLMNTVDKVEEYANRVPNAHVVLDVNHLLHDKPEDAIMRLGNRIKALHISDYDFVYERHAMPKTGKIEWMKVLGALEKVGFKNAFTYELYMKKYGYTFKQIKQNYDELFDEYNSLKK